MSEDHGHHRGRRGTNWAMVAGWAVAVLLAANLVWMRLHTDGGRPQSVLSEGMILAAAFWVPVAALGAAGVAGIVWTARTYRRREKSSVLWMRHAFTAALAGGAVLVVGALDARNFPRPWFVALAAALLAGQAWMFAYAAFRECRRTVGSGHRGGSGRVSSSSADDDDDDESGDHR